MSFSAHADAKGILSLVKNASPKNLVLVHGDVEVMKKFQKTVQDVLKINTYMPPNFEEIPFERVLFYNQIDISKKLFDYMNFMLNTTKNNILSENVKNFKSDFNKAENLVKEKNRANNTNIITKSLHNNDMNNNIFYKNDKEKEKEKTINTNNFLTFENLQNLKNSITLNLKLRTKNGKRTLTLNNPLENLNSRINKITNTLIFKLSDKIKEEIDIKNLFENFLKEKYKKFYQLYSFNISNQYVDFIRENNLFKIKWITIYTDKEKNINKIIFDLINIFKIFLSLFN
jgi:hypothetical protein